MLENWCPKWSQNWQKANKIDVQKNEKNEEKKGKREKNKYEGGR